MRSMQAWLSEKGTSSQLICSLLYSTLDIQKKIVFQMHTAGNLGLEWIKTAYLFFFENDPVEKELKVLICIIYAKLFKAVEGKVLQSTKKWNPVERNTNLQKCRVISKPFIVLAKQVTVAYLKSIDIKDGDRKCFIPRINLPIYSVCKPAEQKGIQDLGNSISVVWEGKLP